MAANRRQFLATAGSAEEFDAELALLTRKLRPLFGRSTAQGSFASLIERAAGQLRRRGHWIDEAGRFAMHAWMRAEPDQAIQAILALAPLVGFGSRPVDAGFASKAFAAARSSWPSRTARIRPPT